MSQIIKLVTLAHKQENVLKIKQNQRQKGEIQER
jgi:hypothetical protein